MNVPEIYKDIIKKKTGKKYYMRCQNIYNTRCKDRNYEGQYVLQWHIEWGKAMALSNSICRFDYTLEQ